jgi:uncharacterized protein (DUF983 family)
MKQTNLKPCPDCGREVSKNAGKCPHCGTELGAFKPLMLGIMFGLIGIVVVGVLLLGLFMFVPVLLHQ